jgi:hypothetical protein
MVPERDAAVSICCFVVSSPEGRVHMAGVGERTTMASAWLWLLAESVRVQHAVLRPGC